MYLKLPVQGADVQCSRQEECSSHSAWAFLPVSSFVKKRELEFLPDLIFHDSYSPLYVITSSCFKFAFEKARTDSIMRKILLIALFRLGISLT